MEKENEKEKEKPKSLTEAIWDDFVKAFELIADAKECNNEFWL